MGEVDGAMDLHAPVLGLEPLLLFHATGAVTYLGEGFDGAGWDDDSSAIMAVAA